MAFSYRLFDAKIEVKLPKAFYVTQFTLGVVIAHFAQCVCVHSLNSLRNLCSIVETEITGSQLVPARSRLVTTFQHIPSIIWSAFGQFPVLTRMTAT